MLQQIFDFYEHRNFHTHVSPELEIRSFFVLHKVRSPWKKKFIKKGFLLPTFWKLRTEKRFSALQKKPSTLKCCTARYFKLSCSPHDFVCSATKINFLPIEIKTANNEEPFIRTIRMYSFIYFLKKLTALTFY